jgi:hypothetical protein
MSIELSARMVYGVQLFQSFVCNMGVNLRGRDVGMSEQQLNHAQVGAVVEQMRSKGMAQYMG